MPLCMRDSFSIILVQYSDKFMHNILLYERLVIKHGGGGGWVGRKNSFYGGLFYGILPLFNEGGSFQFLPEKLGELCMLFDCIELMTSQTTPAFDLY